MSFNITLGNLDQHIAGPINPTSMDQLITAAGNFKFTIHDVQAGSKLGPIPFNLAYVRSYLILQTQGGAAMKDGVDFNFCDVNGSILGTQGHDQGGAGITHAMAGDHGLYFTASFHKPGTYTFTGNKG